MGARAADVTARAAAGLVLIAALTGCQAAGRVWPGPARESATPVPAATHRPPSTPPPTQTAAAPVADPAPGEGVDEGEALIPGTQADLARTAGLNRYSIDLDLDVQALTYAGRETLTYTNTMTTTLDSLVFRLFPNSPAIYGGGALTVTQATVDGQPATLQVDPANPTVLRLVPPQVVRPGEQHEVRLEFEGRVPSDFGTADKGYGVFNFGENVLTLANFYPILAVHQDGQWQVDPVYAEGDAVFSEAAHYTVNLSAPADWTVAATGVEVGRAEAGDEVRRTYESGPVREFMLVLGPELRAISQKVGDTAVNSYFRADNQERGEQALETAASALATYNERFGPYPYRELDVVQAPLNMAAGVEYPGLVLIGSSFYTGTRDAFFDFATIHEVAHQWWYNVVGNDVIDHPWIDEALAQYSSAIHAQDVDGQAEFEQMVKSWQEQVERATRTGMDGAVGAPLSYFAGTEEYGAVVYLKGPLFFHAVREEIGDPAFFESLQRYYKAYKYGIAPARGFVDIAEQVSGKDLDGLYQEWILTGEGIPGGGG